MKTFDARTDGPESSTGTLRLAELTPALRRVELLGLLRRTISEVAGTSASAVSVRDDLATLGLDGDQVAELARRLGAALGRAVAPAALASGGEVKQLARVLERILLAESVEPVAVAPEPGGSTAPEGRPTRPAPAGPALSPAQERSWFLDQLQPGSPLYLMPLGLDLAGPLDRPALARALAGIAGRHEPLRTGIEVDPDTGGPRAWVLPAAETVVPLPLVDLAGLSEDDARREADRLAAGLARRPLDLAAPPLLAATLLRTAPEHHRLVVAVHHAAADGWSLRVVFARELEALYAGRSLASIALTYGDWARRERRRLDRSRQEELVAAWRRRLVGIPQTLDLPTDRPRPPRRSWTGERIEHRLPGGVRERIEALARSLGATRFHVHLAAFELLLARWRGYVPGDPGDRRFLVGSPVAGRDRLDTEGLVGLFVNTVVLRSGVDGARTVGELVARCRDEVVSAQELAAVAFERLVEELAPERDLARPPLVQVLLADQGFDAEPPSLAGLEVTELGLDSGTAKLDLALTVGPAGELSLSYATELFDAATARRLLLWMGRLLVAMVAPGTRTDEDPAHRPLAEVSFLSPSERAAVSLTSSPLGSAFESVPARIVRQALANPEQTALVSPDGLRWSFGDLERASRGLAVLLGEGAPSSPVGAGEPRVAFALEPSLEALVTVLAVWRSGAAFVPLDPTDPPARLARLAAGAGARQLIVRRSLVEVLAAVLDTTEGDGPVLLVWEDLAERVEAAPLPAPSGSPPIHPESLAYVLHTSGSTGEPKAVGVSHRSLAGYLAWVEGAVGTRLLPWITPLTFDASFKQFLAPLLAGRSVHLPPADAARRPERLLAHLEAMARMSRREGHGPVALNCVPSLWREIVATVEAGEATAGLAGLESVWLGGEATTPELVRRSFAVAPDLALHNLYGPTEATANAVAGPIPRAGAAVATGAEPVALGRPVAGLTLTLTDHHLQPVPPGSPGEIVLAGPGLARGYLGQPAATARAFVPDPFTETPGGRLYRTGDLARVDGDGRLLFVGRADDQVQLRGRRIEPGEVATVVAGHPDLAEAVALVLDDAPGSERLVCCVVPRTPADGAREGLAEDLRAFASSSLPRPLVPSEIVVLDALPRTTVGKLDRRALLALLADRGRAAGEDGGSGGGPPRGALEQAVAWVWEEILERRNVERHQDFFRLGGHSLLAGRVAARLARSTGHDVPLALVFERPTVAGLAKALREGAEALGQGEEIDVPRAATTPEQRSAGLPLSSAQERLWFLDRLEPGSATYVIPAAARIRGRLEAAELARLGAAFDQLVTRHEPLRSRFEEGPDGPVQVVEPPMAAGLPRVDLTGLPVGRRQPEAERVSRREASTPFDLTRTPLLRRVLLRLADDHHLLLVSVHHIAADGWSVEVLLRDLAVLAGSGSGSDDLPSLPVAYGDVALAERRWLATGGADAALDAWERDLAGLPPLELPTDQPRPAAGARRGALVPVPLPAETGARVASRAREWGTTPFAVHLAAFAATLGALAGQDDFAVATPVANRRTPEVEPLVGLFVNTLALRVPVGEGRPSFRALVERASRAARDGFARQAVPFERVVERLAPERARDRPPLAQVMLALQAVTGAGGRAVPEILGRPVETVSRSSGTAKLDLTLFLEEAPGAIGGTTAAIEWATELYDRTTVLRWGRAFGRLLAAALETPERPVAELPLLAPEERHQMLHEWGDPGGAPALGAPPSGTTLHGLVDAALATGDPARPVLWGEDGEVWSAEDLRRRSAAVTRRLRLAGVGPGDRVAVALPRRPELVASLLGVLGAGGAYVPLDPDYPAARIAFMLDDSAAAAVVTDSTLAGGLPLPEGLPTVLVDLAFGPPPDAPQVADLLVPVPPEALAYVIYTSGSTGRPKGVALTHGSAVAFLEWAGRRFGPSLRRLFAGTSVSFDLSVFELFAPLVRPDGGVVLGSSALALPGHPRAAEVTFVNTVPSVLAELLGHGGGALPPSVEVVALAGEALPGELVRRVAEASPGRAVAVWNLYGPSESTTYSTWARVDGEGGDAGHRRVRPPIGVPVDGTRARLLDRSLRPVPPGTPGELVLAGAGLARGYLGRPALTAERFVPDPTAPRDEPGTRLYRTGDLARFLADGRLDYLGRLDGQVKVRGFRIETGEVEAALLATGRVEEAVVVARRDVPGAGGDGNSPALVAYVTPTAPANAGAAVADGDLATALRDELGERLPRFLVPGFVVVMDALPRTPSGKVDRRALPAPSAAESAGAGTGRAPRGPVEETLALLWQDLLGLDPETARVTAEDDFFHLGGHSLLAVRLAGRASRAFGVELPLVTLFEHPRLEELAREIARRVETADEVEHPQLAPIESLSPGAAPADRVGLAAPLSYSQERLWFLHRLEPDSVAYHLPLGLDVTGPLVPAKLARALTRLVARQEALRTRFETSPEGPVQRITAPPERLPLPLVDLSGLALSEERLGSESRRLARRISRLPFPLAGPGPVVLLRSLLVRRRVARHLLVLAQHHIASDGWSQGVLVRDLATLYAGEPLPDLAVGTPDVAAWQRRWLDGPALDGAIEAWRERLADLPRLDPPTDHPRSAVRSDRGATVPLRVPVVAADELRAWGRRRGATLFMGLAALVQALLARWTGQDDFALGTPVAGRDRPEVADLVGFFVNTLVLRADVSGAPSFEELVDRVRARLLDAWAHQEAPFERLVEALAPRRDMATTPLFQAMLTVQAPGLPGLEALGNDDNGGNGGVGDSGGYDSGFQVALGECRAAPVAIGLGSAKMDLLFGLVDAGPGRPLAGSLEYAADLFDRTTMLRLARAFGALLGAVLEVPERSVTAAAGLPRSERHQIVVEWDGRALPAVPSPGAPANTLHDLVLHGLAARRGGDPDRPVLFGVDEQGGEETWSARELVDRSAAVAARLAVLGLPPEARVAVALPRRPVLVAGLLGTLRAGAAYVPLDPDYPAERLAFMLEDAAVAAVVTVSDLARRLPLPADLPVVLLDRQPETPTEAAPALSVPPESLAYVIYTSGSTGRPKGVAISHGSAVAFLAWAGRRFGGALEGLYAGTSISFDLSVFELFAPLAHAAEGGSVVLGETTLDLARHSAHPAHPAADRVRFVDTVPSVLAELLRGGPRAGLPEAVTTVALAGEALPAELVARIAESHPGAAVWNLYGPSESTTYATWARVDGGGADDARPHRPPIGRPVDGTRALVVDSRLRPVPLGAVGELVLAGAGLARGYLGRPALTAAAFVPDPTGVPGGRLYRTGDLVRHLADGRLDYLGRRDGQVKVRGFRIETGEVEAALLATGQVVDAAVRAVSSPDDSRVLAAWVVPAGGDAADPAAAERLRGALLDDLEERLPRHMVPSANAVVVLDRLPHTPTGKLDARALPDPFAGSPGTPPVGRAPQGPVEEALASVWRGLLGAERVDGASDFFRLGGHSLQAVRLAGEIERTLGVEVPLAALFEHSRLDAMARHVERLRAEEAEGRPAGAGPGEPLAPLGTEARIGLEAPLSHAQERLWFLHQLDPASAAYHLPLGLDLAGPLDPAALATAARRLVERHEVLRTRYRGTAAGAVQRVTAPPRALPLPVVDLSALPGEVRERASRRTATAWARKPFPLGGSRPGDSGDVALLHPLLMRRGPGRHLLVLAQHHIASDGWSQGLLVRDLAAFYPMATFGVGDGDPGLPELPVQVADVAAWERRHLAESVLRARVAAWRERLADLPRLALPTDRPRPPVRSERGFEVPLVLPMEVADGLRAWGARRGATPFMVLLGLAEVLLARLSGQHDFAVGVPRAGRDRPEVADLVGFFVDTLVLRASIDRGGDGDLGGEPPSFAELVDRVRARALDAWSLEPVPFETLVERLALERDRAWTPLVQAAVSLQDPGLPGLGRRTIELSGRGGTVRAEPVPLSTGTAKHDLTFALFDAGAGTPLAGSLGAAADLFDPTTVRRWAERFVALAGTVLEQPETGIHRLPLLGPADRQQVVEMAVPRDPGTSRGATLDLRVHRHAENRPDATAVTFSDGDGDLTYGDLSRRSRALARALVARGVEPGHVVALFVPRSPDMMVAIVGVLTAGAAYVPLDTGQPDERLVQILEDSGAHLLVRGGGAPPELDRDDLDRRAATLVHDHPVTAVALADLEREGADGAARDTRLPDLAALGGAHMAYVLFTSGSTGRPKGVMIAHHSLERLMAVFQDRHGFGGGDRDDVWTLAHSFAFDASVLEIWSGLWWGGRLVVVPSEVARSPRELWQLVEREGVTAMLQTPALARETVRVATGEGRGPGALRLFLVGGDTVDPGLFDPWFQAYGDRRTEVVNVYGITETTIVDTERALRFPEVRAPHAKSPIGRPFAHVGAVVLDRVGEPVLPGVPGEIHLAGPALAWGYRGRPGRTAETFVPDPTGAPFAALSGTPGGRLYKTGDLARLLPSGDLDYLGRIDRQIQVRGFRIELGEIEAALAALPGVAQSVVVARPDPRGAQLPVAYLVAAQDEEGGDENLVERCREEMARRLPVYMLPAAFVVLPELPLNSSGKVDRRLLPEPGAAGRAVARAPRGVVEQTLALLWRDLTGAAEVSADDDFFHLGGHSLLAVRLVGKIEQAFGVEVPLVEVFEHPRLSDLAHRVERHTALRPVEGAATPPVRHLPTPPDAGPGRAGLVAPLSHSQERLWFLHRLDPASTAYHIPLALDLDGPLAAPALGRALTAVVARHEALRTRFEPGPEGPVQRVTAPVPIALPMVDLTGLDETKGAAEALLQAGRFTRVPFLLGRHGPGLLVRGLLIRRAVSPRSRHLFLVVQHHIASDGWSQGVLVRDLRAFYEAAVPGEAGARPDLPALPVQVADVAAWQRAWLDGEVLAQRTEAWAAALDGVPLLQLPTDRPRPALRSERGATVPFVIPRELAEQLRAAGLARGATLFVVLMATLQALLARRTGRDDFAVGTPVAGRERLEVMDLVGFFVNTLVLRAKVSGDPTFGQLVERVRHRTLDAWSLQDLPFEKLVEVLAPDRDLSHTPLYQVSLALQVPGLPELEMAPGESGRLGLPLGEAWAEPVDPGSDTAKTDLSFALVDGGAGRALHGTVEYSTALFDRTTVERWARSLVILAREASARPDRRLGELPLMSRAERQQALVELVVPRDERPAEGGLERFFYRSAERSPDAVAVTWQDASLTYGELAHRARALARGLVLHGVGSEDVVGLVFDRRPEVLVAILGVMTAGAAYLPLDPSQPDERLGQMAETARPRLLVVGPESSAAASSAAHLAHRGPGDGVAVLGYGDLLAAGEGPRGRAVEMPDLTPLGSDRLAYVLFTSGSTGRPKGVMVPHGGVVQLVERMKRVLGNSPDDVFMLFHSFGFDASVLEMWSAFTAGARLVLVPSEATRSPRELGDLVEREDVTLLIQTPALCRELLALALERQAAGRPWRWERLRIIKVGGEATDPTWFADWFRHRSSRRTAILNLYGITETSIDSTARFLREGDARASVPASPIGRPLGHVGLTLVDRRGEPVPLGTPGELVVVGDSVTRGYIGEPARTAERFLPDPFGHLRGRPGRRLYRTGDLVRLEPSGDLNYLGRIDHQVQVRGFRIELGEIEAAVLATPGVVQAVVTARPDRRGEVRPVAYLVAAPSAHGAQDKRPGLVEAVKAELARRLPDYMMPAAFVVLAELPTNASGKVDRRALPDPDTATAAGTGIGTGTGDGEPARPREAPRSQVEEAIADVWRDVLELDRVGIHDNFFDLGGHSLLATRVHERLLAELDPEMPLMDLFQHPTVSALASALVERGSHRPPATAEVPAPAPATETAPAPAAPEESSVARTARKRAERRRRRRGLAPGDTGSSGG